MGRRSQILWSVLNTVRINDDLIVAADRRLGGSGCKIPLRPGDLSKEPLGFVIINPPSCAGEILSPMIFCEMAPVVSDIYAPSPENRKSSKSN